MQFNTYPERTFRHILSTPFIYGMIIPILFLDVSIEIYHRVSFPLYGLPYVNRSKYIKIDRHKLRKLSYTEKINCAFCGYANGVLSYSATIAGVTEKYWCSIKHKADVDFVEPKHHRDFENYTTYT